MVGKSLSVELGRLVIFVKADDERRRRKKCGRRRDLILDERAR